MSVLPRRSAISVRRLIGVVALWAVLLFLLSLIFNAVGIHMAGGAAEWLNWLDEHKLHFLAWRLCVYAATAGGWMWARRLLLQRSPETQQIAHLMERVALPLVLLLEVSQWLS